MKHRTLALASAAALSLSLLAAGLAPATLANPGPTGDLAASHALTSPSPNHRYILRLSANADQAAIRGALSRVGGSVVGFQPSLQMVVVTAPASALTKLPGVPGVIGVSPDAVVKAQSLGFDYTKSSGSMTNVSRITGASEMWKAGYTGKGIDVALIDTGVAPVSGLLDPAKIVVGPDLSFESQDTSTRYLDSFGHGTNMAGIIAGREVPAGSGSSYAADTTNFYGMAPDARIISIKVADHSGAVDVSQMIAAIDWVVTNQWQDGMNIRVLNISYGIQSNQNAQNDPLSWAAEVAWKHGIAVVASAGNEGASTLGLASPAFNPWVIAVGAEETRGTDKYTDDTVPSFSEQAAENRGPDLVAPGVNIISLGTPGSMIYTTYPAAHIGNGFLRGSGTSQAAAVVSGAAALLLQEFNWLTPDDLKNLLKSTAEPLNNTSDAVQGNGALDLRTAMAASPTASPQKQFAGNGKGSLEWARGGTYVQINGSNLTGETDIMGRAWSSPAMADAAANGTAWSWDGTFNGGPWAGGGMAADTTSWAGRTWQGRTWQGKTWQGKTWQGKTWQGGTWQGKGWSSASWSGPVSATGWASKFWSSAGWK